MIFIDTSAFLAIENPKDSHHQAALQFRNSCLESGEFFITSDYVLDESSTIVRFRASHSIAVQFGEDVQKSRIVLVERLTSEILDEAWQIFKKCFDQNFSFTDCTSFAFMKAMKIKTVFGFDEDFRKYGKFEVMPQ